MKRSLTEVASSIRNGETKSEAVVRECLARIREREHVVHAWAFLDSRRPRPDAGGMRGQSPRMWCVANPFFRSWLAGAGG